jgi:phosphoribosylformimino-5-aminoimidazole carboxamide ribotide isomerase
VQETAPSYECIEADLEEGMIVFPAIDLRRGRCVRLRQGRAEDETVYGDDPVIVARRWVNEGAEWLHVVNLDGAFGKDTGAPGGQINLQRLAEIHAALPGTPVQFGGGVRSLEDVKTALDLGATRAIVGTVAVQNPELVEEMIERFGPERIVIGIDARDGQVATHGWLKTSDTTAVALGQAMRLKGVKRIVYTDIARDGMLTGVNVEATAALARATGLQVIASGGVASLEDIKRLKASHESDSGSTGEIEGVIIGQALYTGVVSLPDAIRGAGAAAES